MWRTLLREAGAPVRDVGPRFRVRFIGWLAHRSETEAVLPLVMASEVGDSALYRNQPEAREPRLDADEASHARVFRTAST